MDRFPTASSWKDTSNFLIDCGVLNALFRTLMYSISAADIPIVKVDVKNGTTTCIRLFGVDCKCLDNVYHTELIDVG